MPEKLNLSRNGPTSAATALNVAPTDPLRLTVLAVLALSAMFALRMLIEYTLAIFSGVADPGLFNRDFANYWIAGNLVLEGETGDLFGPHPDYFRHMVEAFGEDYPWHNWSYPPHYLFFVFWTGLLSFPMALVVFLLATLAAFLGSVRALLGRLDLVTMAFLMPLIAHNIWAGQNGFLTASLAIGALALRDSRPVVAGILLGMLTFKPQLGILLPFLFLAERRWTVIISATCTTIFLIIAAGTVFGWQTWSGYLNEVVPYQKLVMYYLEGPFVSMIPSAYGTFRKLGMGADAALLTHMVLAVPVFIACLWTVFRSPDPAVRTATVLLGTVFVSPYIVSYDMGFACVGLLILARKVGGNRTVFAASLLAACTPVFILPMGNVYLPVTPLLLASAVAFYMAQRYGYFDSARAPRP